MRSGSSVNTSVPGEGDLTDVLPPAISADCLNTVPVNRVHFGQLLQRVPATIPKGSHLQHLTFCELGSTLFSLGYPDAPFPQAIVVIVFRRAKEEMAGIHARRIIAVMANDHSLRNGSIVQLPGHPVCKCVLPIYPDEPIALLVVAAGPFPTTRWVNGFFHLRKEPALERAPFPFSTPLGRVEVDTAALANVGNKDSHLSLPVSSVARLL